MNPTEKSPIVRNVILAALLLIILIILSTAYYKGKFSPVQRTEEPDTIRIKEVYHDTVTIVRYTPPQTVTIYLPDTARRKRIEQGTLVSGVRLEAGELSVEKIDPKGIVTISEFGTADPRFLSLAIDPAGNVEYAIDSIGLAKEVKRIKRKDNLRKAGNWFLMACCLVIGNFIGQQ